MGTRESMTKETESWENKVERWKTPFYKKALMRTGAFLRAALRLLSLQLLVAIRKKLLRFFPAGIMVPA